MIAILDYGAGNLMSMQKALEFIGAEAEITDELGVALGADKIVLPGVGAFGDAMSSLLRSGLSEAVLHAFQKEKPFLGICAGLQLLFESSKESPGVRGLGILRGTVEKIPSCGLKIPQMGWNSLNILRPSRLFKGISEGDFVYFVHSYYPVLADRNDSIASVTYGEELDIAVEKGNFFATQFHPEKSGDVGLCMLENFVRL